MQNFDKQRVFNWYDNATMLEYRRAVSDSTLPILVLKSVSKEIRYKDEKIKQ